MLTQSQHNNCVLWCSDGKHCLHCRRSASAVCRPYTYTRKSLSCQCSSVACLGAQSTVCLCKIICSIMLSLVQAASVKRAHIWVPLYILHNCNCHCSCCMTVCCALGSHICIRCTLPQTVALKWSCCVAGNCRTLSHKHIQRHVSYTV